MNAGYPNITLHRLRHTRDHTAVGCGDILGTRYRLGHRDAFNTVRIHAHELPLTDTHAASTLHRLPIARPQSVLTGHRTGCSSTATTATATRRSLLVDLLWCIPEASLGGEGDVAAHRVMTALFVHTWLIGARPRPPP